ncbi:HlyD family efflux transporter periplasmic adaptor subunit [Solitalea lacus]|uniref:HlyD family efflux transporter periplasmic adaptor subunit n=1 Tax=Solitalea lacus TaxID=2911172 RepID=UPI001EDA7C82|nr:HlyD family efflux transporter periplasmic adaptor subunit [Solitalea lacus]UKJ07509.1 HlyD family secretion protein [Solitalea lacus]
MIRINKWEKLIEHDPAQYKQLGELQSAYQTFSAAFIQLKSYLHNGTYVQKKFLLQKELNSLHELRKSLLAQQNVLNSDYEIASKDFSVKEQLFNEKVIPLLEYKQEQSKYLNKRLPLENLRTSLINNNTSIVAKQQEILALDQQFTDQKSNFLQALNTLISSTDAWKKQYLLIASIAGSVTFPTVLHENQDVKTGQEIFYITPKNAGYYGELQLAQDNFGKIQIGQDVLISLASYPYEEYGKLKGRIAFISKTPNKEGLYQATVKLTTGLKTGNNIDLNFKNGMAGSAEIITKKIRLINKLLFTINKLLNKPGTNPTNPK